MVKSLIVSIMETSGLLGLAHYYHRQRPSILMYHRISDDPMIPGIAPAIFEQQLDYLLQHFCIINMNQLIEGLQKKQLPHNAIAITFDDGHADFYTHAWPRLQTRGLSATLFVTSGFVDQQVWLWPDKLRYSLYQSARHSIHVPPLGDLSLARDRLLSTWNSLGDYCLTLKASERNQFIEQLAQQLKVQLPSAPQAPFAAVTWAQLREMQAQGLDVGSHSVTHPILSSLEHDSLIYELAQSKARIEQELQQSPQGICYPNGMAKDVSTQTEQEAAKHYKYGVVAYPAAVSTSDLFRIGRIGATSNMNDFKLKLANLTRHNNKRGEYR